VITAYDYISLDNIILELKIVDFVFFNFIFLFETFFLSQQFII